MQSITGRVFNVESKYITNPESNEFITIWRNKLDNKYYGRRSDGVDEPLGGGASIGVDCFEKQINGPFDTVDESSTFSECFMYLEDGTYIFDVDYNFRRLPGSVSPPSSIVTEIRTNIINDDIIVMPTDVIQKTRISSNSSLNNFNDEVSVHLMTGKIELTNQSYPSFNVFKASFVDASDQDMQVLNISMRAIKIG